VINHEAWRRVGRVRDRRRQADARRVRVSRALRVAIDDPYDPAVNNARVRGAVKHQVRRYLLHASERVTIVKDLRVIAGLVGEQELLGLELQRVEHPHKWVAQTRTTITSKGCMAFGVALGAASANLDGSTAGSCSHDRVRR